MKLDELMYLVGLASLFLMIPVSAATCAVMFFYGKEPWYSKQYKIAGSLFGAMALLFALMLISAEAVAKGIGRSPLDAVGFFVILFFTFFSARNFRKAYPRLKK